MLTNLQIRRKLEGIRPPRSRPSTKTSFKSATLFFPATSSQKQIVLTLSPDEAVSMLSMHQYMQSNPSAKVPNQEQTLMLLENFQHVAEAALAHEGAGTQQLQTGPASATTPARDHHDAQPADIDSSASDNHPSEGEDAESEVEPAIPQTPMTQPQAQESHLRHGLSAVKNLVATPFKFLSSQAQKASTGTTNEHPVDGNSLFTQPRHIKPPKTPTRSHSHRRTAPQSERRHTAQTSSSISRHHPQTDRRQRHAGISPHGDSEKTPFYLKGVYSAEQIAAIHRKQDRAVEIREEKRIAEIELEEERRAEVRRKSRETQEALIEEEDGVVSNQSAQSNTPSQKRKRDNGRHESGYHYPSPTASELSEIEADIEAEIEADIAAEAAEAAAAVDDDTKMPDFVRDSPAQSRNHGPTSPALGIRKVQKRVTFADEQLASEPVLYNPSVFQQPPAVQANINGGRYPLAPLSMSSPRLASQNVFVANRQTTQARSIFDTSTSRNISMVDQTTQAQSKWEMPDSGKNLEGTFSAPDPDDSESDEDDNNAEEDAREGSTRGETILPQSQSTSSAVLQENRWSQTPPPKPRPMNAVLPQIPSFLENHEVERAQEPHTEPTVDSLKAPQSPAPLFMLGNHKVTRVEAPTTSAIGPSLAPSHPTPSFAAPSFQSPAAPGSSFAASSPATDSPSAPSRAAPMTLGNYPVKRATEPTAGIPATPQPPATQSPASRPRLTAAELFAAPSSSAPLSASKLFAADLARAKAEMHKPKQPSLLRNVKIMSPLQQEQELRERQKREQEKREQDESDKENRGVIRAVVNSVTYPWEDSRNGFSKEVADAVEAAFKNWKEVNPPMDREEVRRAAGWNVSEVDREVDKHL
jgi:hypothetical protein